MSSSRFLDCFRLRLRNDDDLYTSLRAACGEAIQQQGMARRAFARRSVHAERGNPEIILTAKSSHITIIHY
jgi:hypothetical protein